ncbi:hypothetical protein TNCV_1159691 [Trichonephila clavipes]|nr:hypothetical protein TNCV_1159691 [Trichonephila clavipes]
MPSGPKDIPRGLVRRSDKAPSQIKDFCQVGGMKSSSTFFLDEDKIKETPKTGLSAKRLVSARRLYLPGNSSSRHSSKIASKLRSHYPSMSSYA